MTRADAGAFNSPFVDAAEGSSVSLGSGVTGTITYMANWTGTQLGSSPIGENDVAVIVTVPEPATWAALLASTGFVIGWRRSRRRESVGA